jgi:hypothetical protein
VGKNSNPATTTDISVNAHTVFRPLREDLTETKENHVYTGDDMSQANWEELRDTTENHNDTNSHVGEATKIDV